MNSAKLPRGLALLQNPTLNKGTAFTEEERDVLGLRGLLPPAVQSQADQLERVIGNLREKSNTLDRYVSLIALQDRNETLFYRLVVDNIEEMMPLIYTPTVGLACQRFGHIFRRTRGLYISENDRGSIAKVLRNWPTKDVRVIVVTDGERILGLGDLGANGMGIPIGKLSLYTACAGIDPTMCLPITIDAGTNNKALFNDPLYLGLHKQRTTGAEYDVLIDEFMAAAQEVFPKALIQFEDFANHNAFRFLLKYRDSARTFNDDIQGTASVALAGLYSALRITGGKLADQRLLFFGAGEAGTGIGELVVSAMIDEGVPEAQARKCCWFVDSKGLVVKSRTDLVHHKLPFAHDHEPMADLMAIMETLRPTALIGASGQHGTFSQAILETAARLNERPIVFALSNPTSQAECTAEQAYTWTEGRAVFASGSPFAPVTFNGQHFVPGQGNNVYIFPGVGLGVLASGSRLVPNEMFLVAARELAKKVTQADLDQGRVYPSLTRIREVSQTIAVELVKYAAQHGLATVEIPEDIEGFVRSHMFEPDYKSYV